MIYKLFGICLVAMALSTGCQDKGPMEKAGESVDNAIDDAGDAVEMLPTSSEAA